MNAPERPEYSIALNALEPLLFGWPPKVVVIDGRPDVGKTTLGRFLAWRFNVSLIETDLFLKRNQGGYFYNEETIRAVIIARQHLPVIIEGVVALRLLSDLNIPIDFHIHVTCETATASVCEEYGEYLRTFKPMKTANLVLEFPKLP